MLSKAKDPSTEELRAMAKHRGLKLLRSRKRTPGVGDFGKYGLIGGDGQALLGVGIDGLTATATEIADFLRGGTRQSWHLSHKVTPVRRKAAPAKRDDDDQPRTVERIAQPKESIPKKSTPTKDAPPSGPPRRSPPLLRLVPPAPTPALQIRRARRSDLASLRDMLRQLKRPPRNHSVAKMIANIRKSGGDILVAKWDKTVGCCVWSIIPTVQDGSVARISLLLVDTRHRRRGIGTALLYAACQAAAKTPCELIEVMSDITVNNAHGFFRAKDFDQKSYRFIRSIAQNS